MKNFRKIALAAVAFAALSLGTSTAFANGGHDNGGPNGNIGYNWTQGDQQQLMATGNAGWNGQMGLSGQGGLQMGDAQSLTIGNGSAGFAQSQLQENEHYGLTTGPNGYIEQGGNGSQFQTSVIETGKRFGTADVCTFQGGAAGSMVFNSGATGVAIIGGGTLQTMAGGKSGNGEASAFQTLSQTEGYYQYFQTPNGQSEQWGTLNQGGSQWGQTQGNGCNGSQFQATGGQLTLAGTGMTYKSSGGSNMAMAGQGAVMVQGGQSDKNSGGQLEQNFTTGYQQLSTGPNSSIYQTGTQTGFQKTNY